MLSPLKRTAAFRTANESPEGIMRQPEQWQVTGSAAENYEQYLVPAIFAPWAADLIDVVAPKPGERFLDVACGTGILARLVAERIGNNGRIVGLDVNPGMLSVARMVSQTAPIEWQEASAVALPFENGSFDVVVCQQGLQFIPDRPAAVREMHRVLIPNGRVGIATWRGIDHAPGFAALAAAVAHQVGVETAAPLRGPFGLAEESDLRALLTDAEFQDIRVRTAVRTLEFPSVEEFARRYLSASPLAGVVGELSDTARNKMMEELRSALLPHVSAEGLRFPIQCHLTTAVA
jgi:ubiquinone/menaquinone biosynthesis C-methylase UbiE